MQFEVRYHPRVLDRDIKKIPTADRKRIAKAIEDRLLTEPARFGKPLAGALWSYWKLRVGDYRVVYRLDSKSVRVLAVIHRKDVYDDAKRRLDIDPGPD